MVITTSPSMAATPSGTADRQPVPVTDAPSSGISLRLATDQAGRVVSIGSHQGRRRLAFARQAHHTGPVLGHELAMPSHPPLPGPAAA